MPPLLLLELLLLGPVELLPLEVLPLEPQPKIPQPLELLLPELLPLELLLDELTELDPEPEELEELELELELALTELDPLPDEELLPLELELLELDAALVLSEPLELLPLLPPGPLPPVNTHRPAEQTKPVQQSVLAVHVWPELRQTPPPVVLPDPLLGGQAARQSVRPAASVNRRGMKFPLREKPAGSGSVL